MKFLRSPFACEILTKSSKGMYSSTYVDIELKSLGLHPLVQEVSHHSQRDKVIDRSFMLLSEIGDRACCERLHR
ncbi:hypothetical protein TcYC6_0024310 [Trypanosoma cruzi]|nr:hypothetical protein TcYC6_0024310 [Trypanosoma cruzi]